MTWYLAGPMTGIPESNYPEFERVSRAIRALGYTVVSPHELAPHPTEPTKEKYLDLLRLDLEALCKCDGIILMPGWSGSTGAKLELQTAIGLGKRVAYYSLGTGLISIS